MDLDKLILGILVFSVFIVTGSLFMSDINTNYAYAGVNLSTEDFSAVYDTSEKLYNTSQDTKTSILGGNVDDEETENSIFRGTFSALRAVKISLELIGDIINSMANVLPIPPYFISFALAALALTISFALIYIIFRIAKG